MKDILPYIQECIDDNGVRLYVEPFVGGANVIDSVDAESRLGSDVNKELIALLRYMSENPALPMFPDSCSFEHYAEVREDRKRGKLQHKFPTEYIAGIGYFASFGGRYFDGGYGRDRTGKRNIYAERLKYAREQARRLKGITFCHAEYDRITELCDIRGAMIYCDPPYRGTKAYDGKGGFDYEKFYSWLRRVSMTNYVLVSEYGMPEDFKCLWLKERKVMQKSLRTAGETFTERLFTLEGGLYDVWAKER